MKTKLVLGMVAAAVTISFSTAFAGGARAVDMMPEYSKTVKESVFHGQMTAAGLSGTQMKMAQDKLVNNALFKVDSKALTVALNKDSSKKTQRLENLAVVIAATKMAAKISETDAVEGESLQKAAQASAKVIVNSAKVGLDKSSDEMKEVTEALIKLESLPESILTRFSKAERDSYTQIIEKQNELLTADSGPLTRSSVQGKSAEAAFVEAIMQVKGVDRTKALEVVRKLKECV